MFHAHVLGQLKYTPVHGWKLESVNIASQAMPLTRNTHTLWIPLLPPFPGKTWADAYLAAEREMKKLKPTLIGVKFPRVSNGQ